MKTKLPYGTLNPITPREGQSRLSNRLPNSLFGQLKKNMKESMANDVFANTGPYKGIVLRVDKPTGGYAPDDYTSRFFEDVKGQVPSTIVVKVRIPEIHAHLPVPEAFGSEDGPHQQIINMYPDFVFQGADVAPIAPEDIIVVDFTDRKNMRGGVVINADTSTVAPGLECSPREGFGSTPPMMAQSAQGDPMGASSAASPNRKISNTDPNSRKTGYGGATGNNSDRVIIAQDYPYKVPFSKSTLSADAPVNGGSGSNESVATSDDAINSANSAKNLLTERVNIQSQENSKSMILYASSLGKTKFMRTPRDAARRARKSGIDTVFLEAIWQGPPEGDFYSPEQKTYALNILRKYARGFSKAGISVFLWGRVMKGMSREFIEYMFMLAKKVGALGVVVNPDSSYCIQSTYTDDIEAGIAGNIVQARETAELVKSKAAEFKLISGVLLPWFMKTDRDRMPNTPVPTSRVPEVFQETFPYEVFYGFDLYLIDARWSDKYNQFGASIQPGLSLLGFGAAGLPALDSAPNYDYPVEIDDVAQEYKRFIEGSSVESNDGDSYDGIRMYTRRRLADGTYSTDTISKCIHGLLNYGEKTYGGVAEADLLTTTRNYIPILSVGGSNFYTGECTFSGFKSPSYFKNEVKSFIENNTDGASKVKSICISDWKQCGEHHPDFVQTRWQMIENLQAGVTANQNNLDFTDPSNNILDPDEWLFFDPNDGKGLDNMIQRGMELFNNTNKPSKLNKASSPPSGENNNLSSGQRADPSKSCPSFNDVKYDTPYDTGCSLQNNAGTGPNQGSGGQFGGGGSSGGGGSGGGGGGSGSNQSASSTAPTNAMDSIDCNPTNTVGTVGGASSAGNSVSDGGSPAGAGSAGTANGALNNGGPSSTNTNGNLVSSQGGAPAEQNNIFGPDEGSSLAWSASAGTVLNAETVDYMNELSENIYSFLPRNSPAFTSGRNPRSKVRTVRGVMTIERMIYLMFDKIVSKSSGGRVTTSLYDSLYKKWWQQHIKTNFFMAGLRSNHSHSKIRADAVEEYKRLLSGGQITQTGHASGNSLDLESKHVHAAMNEKSPYNMSAAQLHRTRYTQAIKMAARKSQKTVVCAEDYPQHIHVETR